MPNDESTELARRLKLVLTIDDRRPADDPLKLPAELRKDVADDLKTLEAADAATGSAEGGRTEASKLKRQGYEELERQLRGGHRFIAAIDEEEITDAERAGVFESYLWKGGKLGTFDDGRCVELARQAVAIGSGTGDAALAVKPAFRYPEARLERIKAQLAIIEGKTADASGGDRQQATRTRDTAKDLAETTLLRVRFWYCCATRDADRTPELAKIEFQPRREYGSGSQAGGKPDGPEGEAGAGNQPAAPAAGG